MHKSINKDYSLKRTSMLAIILLTQYCFCVSMEPSPQLMPVINTKVRTAFHSFGLQTNGYTISVLGSELTPKESVPRWKVTNKHIEFSSDICKNAALVEFAAYCSAAYIKNNSYRKSQVAGGLTGAAIVALPPLTIITSQSSPYHCYLGIGALLVSLAAGMGDAVKKVTQAVDTYLATRAFSDACQKLRKQSNFETLATYYAFAKLIKHAPVGQDQQTSIIQKCLNRDGFSIECIIRDNSREVRIETADPENEEKLLKLASVFYPPQ